MISTSHPARSNPTSTLSNKLVLELRDKYIHANWKFILYCVANCQSKKAKSRCEINLNHCFTLLLKHGVKLAPETFYWKMQALF